MDSVSGFPLRLLITLCALALVLVLAYAVLRFAASLTVARRGEGRLKVLETLPIGSRERLVLVELDAREYLVGVGSHGISLLDAGGAERSTRTDDKEGDTA